MRKSNTNSNLGKNLKYLLIKYSFLKCKISNKKLKKKVKKIKTKKFLNIYKELKKIKKYK